MHCDIEQQPFLAEDFFKRRRVGGVNRREAAAHDLAGDSLRRRAEDGILSSFVQQIDQSAVDIHKYNAPVGLIKQRRDKAAPDPPRAPDDKRSHNTMTSDILRCR